MSYPAIAPVAGRGGYQALPVAKSPAPATSCFAVQTVARSKRSAAPSWDRAARCRRHPAPGAFARQCPMLAGHCAAGESARPADHWHRRLEGAAHGLPAPLASGPGAWVRGCPVQSVRCVARWSHRERRPVASAQDLEAASCQAANWFSRVPDLHSSAAMRSRSLSPKLMGGGTRGGWQGVAAFRCSVCAPFGPRGTVVAPCSKGFALTKYVTLKRNGERDQQEKRIS